MPRSSGSSTRRAVSATRRISEWQFYSIVAVWTWLLKPLKCRKSHKNEGPTRYDIWVAVYGEPVPRDDSAQADLYRMLIRDLSTGGVIRQPRESDGLGRF